MFYLSWKGHNVFPQLLWPEAVFEGMVCTESACKARLVCLLFCSLYEKIFSGDWTIFAFISANMNQKGVASTAYSGILF